MNDVDSMNTEFRHFEKYRESGDILTVKRKCSWCGKKMTGELKDHDKLCPWYRENDSKEEIMDQTEYDDICKYALGAWKEWCNGMPNDKLSYINQLEYLRFYFKKLWSFWDSDHFDDIDQLVYNSVFGGE